MNMVKIKKVQCRDLLIGVSELRKKLEVFRKRFGVGGADREKWLKEVIEIKEGVERMIKEVQEFIKGMMLLGVDKKKVSRVLEFMGQYDGVAGCLEDYGWKENGAYLEVLLWLVKLSEKQWRVIKDFKTPRLVVVPEGTFEDMVRRYRGSKFARKSKIEIAGFFRRADREESWGDEIEFDNEKWGDSRRRLEVFIVDMGQLEQMGDVVDRKIEKQASGDGVEYYKLMRQEFLKGGAKMINAREYLMMWMIAVRGLELGDRFLKRFMDGEDENTTILDDFFPKMNRCMQAYFADGRLDLFVEEIVDDIGEGQFGGKTRLVVRG